MAKANIILFYDFLCRSMLNGNWMLLLLVGDYSLVEELWCFDIN